MLCEIGSIGETHTVTNLMAVTRIEIPVKSRGRQAESPKKINFDC